MRLALFLEMVLLFLLSLLLRNAMRMGYVERRDVRQPRGFGDCMLVDVWQGFLLESLA